MILCSDLLYWGGWDLLVEDTRKPLIDALISTSDEGTRIYFAWIVRNVEREREFVELAGFFLQLDFHLLFSDWLCQGDFSGWRKWYEGTIKFCGMKECRS